MLPLLLPNKFSLKGYSFEPHFWCCLWDDIMYFIFDIVFIYCHVWSSFSVIPIPCGEIFGLSTPNLMILIEKNIFFIHCPSCILQKHPWERVFSNNNFYFISGSNSLLWLLLFLFFFLVSFLSSTWNIITLYLLCCMWWQYPLSLPTATVLSFYWSCLEEDFTL